MKKLLTGGGILAAGALTAKAYAPDVYDTVAENAEKAVDVLGNVGSSINTFAGEHLGEILDGAHPMAGDAAPFALPMVAGGYLAHRLADLMKVENKVTRRLMTAAGTVGGALLHESAISGHITGGAIVAAGLVPAGYVLKGIGKTILGGGGAVVGGITAIPGGMKRGGKNGWDKI